MVYSTDEEVCSPCEREFDRHCKVQLKRHRDREPSRLPIKKIISSKKKTKTRRKLERIFRKSTLKSSSLYKLATDYKLWYVTYVHRYVHLLKKQQQTFHKCRDICVYKDKMSHEICLNIDKSGSTVEPSHNFKKFSNSQSLKVPRLIEK